MLLKVYLITEIYKKNVTIPLTALSTLLSINYKATNINKATTKCHSNATIKVYYQHIGWAKKGIILSKGFKNIIFAILIVKKNGEGPWIKIGKRNL